MKIHHIALILGLLATPTFAQSIDLPRLTWPTETAAPTSQGCNDPTQTATTTCAGQ